MNYVMHWGMHYVMQVARARLDEAVRVGAVKAAAAVSADVEGGGGGGAPMHARPEPPWAG